MWKGMRKTVDKASANFLWAFYFPWKLSPNQSSWGNWLNSKCRCFSLRCFEFIYSAQSICSLIYVILGLQCQMFLVRDASNEILYIFTFWFLSGRIYWMPHDWNLKNIQPNFLNLKLNNSSHIDILIKLTIIDSRQFSPYLLILSVCNHTMWNKIKNI